LHPSSLTITLERVVPDCSALEIIEEAVIMFSRTSRHPPPQRKLERRVATKPRRTLTILNRLDDVKQGFEKDYLRKLNMKYNGVAPTVVNRIKAIERKVSSYTTLKTLGLKDYESLDVASISEDSSMACAGHCPCWNLLDARACPLFFIGLQRQNRSLPYSQTALGGQPNDPAHRGAVSRRVQTQEAR
jgi:hypothetical protein